MHLLLLLLLLLHRRECWLLTESLHHRRKRLLPHQRRQWHILLGLLLQKGLSGNHFVLIVIVELATVQERKLGIALLFRFGHRLKFWTIAGHEISELINYVPQFDIVWC
uniref:Putative secreted protein n=1 Tax=Anopheles marajoara TaxID=58244 RepID=A0A2M4C808_9DIPT